MDCTTDQMGNKCFSEEMYTMTDRHEESPASNNGLRRRRGAKLLADAVLSAHRILNLFHHCTSKLLLPVILMVFVS